MPYAVEMRDVTVRFPGVVANDCVSFGVQTAEVHALLGENGAGKSTLMGVLFGTCPKQSGELFVDGRSVCIRSPRDAARHGIGMVHQHFNLVHNLTVSENIVLGVEPRARFARTDVRAAHRAVGELCERYGLAVDPYAKIQDITVGMQQRVEILKMLYRDARVLIFDEPTAVLAPQEVQQLMQVIRRLAREGKAVVLITHKLSEIKAIADRCTVLRRGACIGTVSVAEVGEERLVEMMVGHAVDYALPRASRKDGACVLEVRSLSVGARRVTSGQMWADASPSAAPRAYGVRAVSFQVRCGEILCITGVDGNGQSQLLEAIAGLVPVSEGQILLDGCEIQRTSVRERVLRGVSYIPEDRRKHGLVLDFSVEENMVLRSYFRAPFARRGILDRRVIAQHAHALAKKFEVQSGALGCAVRARTLSGGNQQKVIIARELHRAPRLLIAAQPTRGLDLGAVQYVHRAIVAERNRGGAVLLFSLDMDEVLALADSIAVMYEGEIVGTVHACDATEQELGRLMSGMRKKEKKKKKTGVQG